MQVRSQGAFIKKYYRSALSAGEERAVIRPTQPGAEVAGARVRRHARVRSHAARPSIHSVHF